MNFQAGSCRPLFRRGVRALLAWLPEGAADFVYRQIKGSVRDIGGYGAEERVALRGGGEMVLDLADSQQRHVYYCGFYEHRFIACLSRYLLPGDRFVDIGANVGYFTVWAARRVGAAGRVFSFEPNPQAYRHLSANVGVNGLANVTLFNTAVGETESTAFLTTDRNDTATSRLIRDPAGARGVTVPVRALDACLAQAGSPRIACIKIDAEGAETAILRGAEKTLRNEPYLLIEVDEKLLTRLGSSDRELLALLDGRGYTPYQVGRRGELMPLPPDAKRVHNYNLFFAPRRPGIEGRGPQGSRRNREHSGYRLRNRERTPT